MTEDHQQHQEPSKPKKRRSKTEHWLAQVANEEEASLAEWKREKPQLAAELMVLLDSIGNKIDLDTLLGDPVEKAAELERILKELEEFDMEDVPEDEED